MSKKPGSRNVSPLGSVRLLRDLRGLIEQARNDVARQVNSTLVHLYWRVGRRVLGEILRGKRAEYGQRLIVRVSAVLMAEFGRGWSRPNLDRMTDFARSFRSEKIVATLSHKLSWSHFKEILPLHEDLKRDFYAELCRLENWSVRTLRRKIAGMLFERTALSRKPRALIRQELDVVRKSDRMTPDIAFRDPYFLDFLGLKDRYLEKDLEEAIMRDLEKFILELGSDFSFVARQKRITIDGEDHSLDLLFFHRGLRRLVALDLKLGVFQAGDKGQMELYLKWLEKHEQRAGEDPPIGLILCAGNKEETVELLELEKSRIRVATYWTRMLPKQLLRRKLREAMRTAQERFVRKDAGKTLLALPPKRRTPRD